MANVVCVKCERESTTTEPIFSIDTKDPEGAALMAKHFEEAHGVLIANFKVKDKSELHY